VERGNFESSRPMLRLSLEICRENPTSMPDVLADVLSSHVVLAMDANVEKQFVLNMAQEHLDQRHNIDDGSDDAKDNIAMAEGEVAQAYMLCGKWDEAIEHCDISIGLSWELPGTIQGLEFPHFSMMRKAASLSALGRQDEAAMCLLETLEFRRNFYGPDDMQSCK